MEIWIATSNKGKLGEFKLLFEKEIPGKVTIFSQSDLSAFHPRPEDGKTFLDNARIKAKSLKALKSNNWVIGEDSGLEVEALNNLPGIHSARYAGPKASDSENLAKILKMLQLRTATNRKARFLCTLVAYSPSGEEMIFTGQLNGSIEKNPRGQMGFGYDPIFVPDGESKTLAELGPAFKTKHSHRAQATLEFIQKLKSFL